MGTKTAKPKHLSGIEHAIQKAAQAAPCAVAEKRMTKTTDNKGRVVLGGRFANRVVIVETLSETEINIKLARVIPENEAWLYDNAEAIKAVRTGLAQARAGNVKPGPDMDADAKFVAGLED